jgi:hypothetical protein
VNELGRVLDPNELDRADGQRGRLTIDVLTEWLVAGDTVELVAPARIVCARCEGGGCDACERSGALRLNGDVTARTIRLTLPPTTSSRVLVRLLRPLGDDAGLEQLSVEVRASSTPGASCRRVEPATSRGPSLTLRSVALGIAIVVLFALAVAVSAR